MENDKFMKALKDLRESLTPKLDKHTVQVMSTPLLDNRIKRPTNKRSVLLYDPNCSFCTDTAMFLQSWIGKTRLLVVPNNVYWAPSLHNGLTHENIQKNVHLIVCKKLKGRRVEYKLYSGGGAVANVLSMGKRLGFIKYIYKVWPFAKLIDFVYWMTKKTKKYYPVLLQFLSS